MSAMVAEEQTPRMSFHARLRCAEMGISTKVAKWIVRHADIDRPGRAPLRVAVCDEHPDYAVVYHPEDLIVVTVVFRTTETYRRDGQTFEVEETVKITRKTDG